VEQVISIGAVNAPRDFPLAREIKRTAMMEIEVISKDKPAEPAAAGDFVLVRVDNPDANCFGGRALKDAKWDETSFSGTLVRADGKVQASARIAWTRPPAVIKVGQEVSITVTGSHAGHTNAIVSVSCWDAGDMGLWHWFDSTNNAMPTKTMSFKVPVPQSERISRITISVASHFCLRLQDPPTSGLFPTVGTKNTIYHYERKAQ